MGAVATFSFSRFAARYPEFANLSPETASDYFTEATLYLANDGSGPVADANQQLVLLNMLTAHIAKLNLTIAGPDGSVTSAAGIAGRVSSASEGSVSISVEAFGSGSSALLAWLGQTTYGMAFWAATSRYRTMRYRPRAGRVFNPPYR